MRNQAGMHLEVSPKLTRFHSAMRYYTCYQRKSYPAVDPIHKEKVFQTQEVGCTYELTALMITYR